MNLAGSVSFGMIPLIPGSQIEETPGLARLREKLVEVFGNFFQFRHAMSVALVSYCIAKASGFSESDCLRVAEAAFLHDIGKEWHSIKPYFMSPDRTNTLRQNRMRMLHCERGARQLEQYEIQLDENDLLTHPEHLATVHYVQRYHHNAPLQLPKTDQDQIVHIVKVADIFDVITGPVSERPYRGRGMLTTKFAVAEELWQQGVKKKGQLDAPTTLRFITKVMEIDYNFQQRVFVI